VLRLQGSGLCDLKLDRCVASDQTDSYLEPDGRSGITSPSSGIKARPLFKGGNDEDILHYYPRAKT
jgi:hypothetical protein